MYIEETHRKSLILYVLVYSTNFQRNLLLCMTCSVILQTCHVFQIVITMNQRYHNDRITFMIDVLVILKLNVLLVSFDLYHLCDLKQMSSICGKLKNIPMAH